MVLLITDKVDFQTRSILSHKEVHYKIIKEWIHQEEITILYVSVRNNRALKLRMENSKIRLCIYGKLVFDKAANRIQWGKDNIFKNDSFFQQEILEQLGNFPQQYGEKIFFKPSMLSSHHTLKIDHKPKCKRKTRWPKIR